MNRSDWDKWSPEYIKQEVHGCTFFTLRRC